MKVDDFQEFMIKVNKKSGIDLTQYKENQMKRRLTSLRNRRGFDRFDTYFSAMEKDPEMFAEFLERMTINVTNFFRNKQQWKVLEKEIPKISGNKGSVKAWSAACSTGEEPYSLSMLLMSQPSVKDVKILATDLDENALEQAKKGRYRETSLKELPAEYEKKYFVKHDFSYEVKDEIKRTVTFKKHNLLSDPYESGFDLILCRNVMIYFTEETKAELYRKFARALRPGGLLFVGNTEQIFQPQEYGLELIHSFFYVKSS